MSPGGRLIAKLLIEMGLLTLVLAGLLVGAAGTVEWPSGWVYLGLFTALGLGVSLWLAKADPGLLEERLKPTFQAGQKAWDKVFLVGVMVVYVSWTALLGLDARRFYWSHVPVWASRRSAR